MISLLVLLASAATPCAQCEDAVRWDLQLIYCRRGTDPAECGADTALSVRTPVSFATRDRCSLGWQQVAAQPLYAPPADQYVKARCVPEEPMEELN